MERPDNESVSRFRKRPSHKPAIRVQKQPIKGRAYIFLAGAGPAELQGRGANIARKRRPGEVLFSAFRFHETPP